MKVKKFLVLSIFTFMVAIFFTGCSYNITEEVKQIQSIAENVIAEEDYVVPRDYVKSIYTYATTREKCICIYNAEEGIQIDFKTTETYPKMKVIYFVKRGEIYKAQINEFEGIAYNVLNGVSIEMWKNYNVIVSEQKLKISEKQNNGTIIVTFDISKDTPEIVDVEICVNEKIEILRKIVFVSNVLLLICYIIFLYKMIIKELEKSKK